MTTGCVEICIHTDSPVARPTRNSTAKFPPLLRNSTQRRSHSVRSCGKAFVHGAVPTTSGAPSSTNARNASLPVVRRQLTSVSKTPIGRAAVVESMETFSQTERPLRWTDSSVWLTTTESNEAIYREYVKSVVATSRTAASMAVITAAGSAGGVMATGSRRAYTVSVYEWVEPFGGHGAA